MSFFSVLGKVNSNTAPRGPFADASVGYEPCNLFAVSAIFRPW
jgi:hypothetical protein